MKALSTDSFLARLLARLAAVVCRHPRWFFYPQIALFVACVVYTVCFLQFNTNRDDLVDANAINHQNYLRLKKEFPQQSDLVVVIESENIEKNRQFAERIGAKLEAETNLFTDVFYKGDLPMMGAKALLFVPDGDLGNLKQTLHSDLPFIKKFTQTTNLVSFFEQINTAIRTASRDTNAQTESLIQSLPALTRIVTQADDTLSRLGTPPSPGVTALFDAGDEAVRQTYITFAGGKIFLVTAHAPVHDLNGPAVERIRQLIKETQDEVPGLNVGLTGEPVLEQDEMAQSQKDTAAASIVALILCALIFIYGYNETGRPVKATICLVVGLGYTMAFATLAVGHLNILTITFAPILIGLAIDYGVHLVTRYEEELRHGKTEEEALTKAMVFTGQGIFIGALTTAGAFLVMGLTHFKGIQEMGIICGGGLVVCLVPMMTLLPVLLLRGRQNVLDHKIGDIERRARIENLWLQRPVLVTVIVTALCALALTQVHKVYFDYNLLNMQSAGMPAVVFEQKLIDSADKSVIYGAVVADSLAHAVALEEKIKKLPTVASNGVQSIAFFLNQDQTKKLKLIGQIKEDVAPLQFGAADLHPVNVAELARTLYSLYGYLGAALDEVKDSNSNLTAELIALRSAIIELKKSMLDGDATQLAIHADKLAEYQRALFADVRETFRTLQKQDDSSPLRVEDLPPALRNRFVGVSGKFLLQVYPKYDVWQRDKQEEFITSLRPIAPHLTGTPVQLYEYTTLLKNSYITAAWYSLAAITVLVFIHFRSFGAVILSLLPVGIGTLWLAGLMGWLNIPFNPANIMTLPLVIGIGVTNGIHILNRFAEERTPGILSRSTGKAVLVSGLTAIAGFGSLMLAKHRGIHSLGCVMASGIATCMIAGLAFLPALLNLLGRWKPLIEKPDVGRTSPTPGQEEPR
ncbi:MAG: MMPL family transporter [Verrucomicrobiales bacterium]|nr:MMPL family transporter [Verrucomicrobiales bacterium]